MAAELILTLHGIGPPHQGVPSDERFYWVTEQAFVSLLQTVAATRQTSGLPVAITFDDGNESDAVIALPELVKRNLKATFFIVGARIGMPHYLDREALTDLVSAGMEIGTHGTSHCDWRTLDETTLHLEIADGRRRVEDICGMAVTKAAIPFGSYDRGVLKQLRSERLECVYTSDGGLAESSAWLKPRQTISSTVPEADIKCLVTSYPTLRSRLHCRAAMIYKSLRWRH